MAITIKEENILDEWSMILDQAAGHGDALLDDIQRRLEQAEIPGGCAWSVEEVQSATWLSRIKREFLVVGTGSVIWDTQSLENDGLRSSNLEQFGNRESSIDHP